MSVNEHDGLRWSRVVGLAALTAVVAGSDVVWAQAAAAGFTLSAARALDLDSGKVIANPLLRIERGVITELSVRTAGQMVDRDLGDVTLLPGLIDAHVHLTGAEEQTPDEKRRETAA